MSKHLLELRSLSVSAGGRALISNLNLTVTKGEIVGITGPSGCGKTSLLRAISGLDDPANGSVLVSGKSGDELGWPQFRRLVVLVNQRPVLADDSVEANLMRPFAYASAQQPFPETRAGELLEHCGLGVKCMGQDARSLSIGEQQRVCIIRALLVEPAVLLFDEPTSALDKANVQLIEQLMREGVASQGMGAIVVSHDTVQVERLCDRHVELEAAEQLP